MTVSSSKSRKVCLKAAALATVATTALTTPGLEQHANAQALQPVVDVCTGVTLPRSAVTEVIGAVNAPIVEQLETTVNGITTVTLILAPLVTLPDLNIDLSSILEDAAEGDPISLQILDTDGNVIGASDDCNVGADNFTLNEEGGIEIGGNRISGLGTNGQEASAGEADAIAFGNNATTAPGATGAIAFGTGATASAANSVALGAGSVADRANTVSVGAVGAERQIANVAAGTADSDAATVGQLNAAIAGATDGFVAYDGAAQTSVTLGGAGGTTVTNVAPGALNGSSTDAVNGSQLFATNQNVAANAADITALDGRVATAEGNITVLDGRVTTTEGNISLLDGRLTTAEGTILSLDGRVTANEGDIASLDGRVTTNEGDIAALDTRVGENETDIAALDAITVQYDDASADTVTLNGANGTTITNLADGELSATSTDAVNGSQLFATNQAVSALDGRVTQNETNIATNTTNIANLQTTIGNVQVTIGEFDGRITQNETDIANLDNRVTVNEGDIVDLDNRVTVNETDIANLDNRVTVNEGDIANLDGRVTVNEGDIANLDGRVTVNEGDIANLDGRVTINEGDIANLDGRVTVNEGDIANLDGRVTVNEGDITDLDGRVTVNEGNISSIDVRVTGNTTEIANLQTQLDNVPVGYVSDADRTTPSATPTNTARFENASGGPVSVTNVAAGQLSASSTDAVNGAQLFATNQNIERIENNLTGSTVVAVQYSNPETPTQSNGGTVTNDVTLVGAGASAPVRLHNVANGLTDTDAVNLGQLRAGLDAMMTTSMDYTDERFTASVAYTDMRIEEVAFDLAEMRDEAFAGTAAAMAMANIPQAVEPGRSMIGGGVGHFRGGTAFGMGYSTTFSDGRAVVKVSGTIDTKGRGGVAAGAGFSF